jgi:hypothetical protein
VVVLLIHYGRYPCLGYKWAMLVMHPIISATLGWAIEMINKGKAYVDEHSAEEIDAKRVHQLFGN